ncbi:hypothetical protein BC833DRAFT_563738 [Globomyces pollinis-pini]|nr:hypothetical protein BC833DRAFT_563738 [Globomyces pollinis-pini]
MVELNIEKYLLFEVQSTVGIFFSFFKMDEICDAIMDEIALEGENDNDTKMFLVKFMLNMKEITIKNEEEVLIFKPKGKMRHYNPNNTDIENQIHLCASMKLRDLSLEKFKYQSIPWTEKLDLFIGLIAKARYNGILQSDLSKALGIEARITFHHLKMLKPAIEKVAVHAANHHSNVIFHKRFVELSKEYQSHISRSAYLEALDDPNTILEPIPNQPNESGTRTRFSRQEITNKLELLLDAATGNILREHDIMNALQVDTSNRRSRKLFNDHMSRLCKLSFVEKVTIPRKLPNGTVLPKNPVRCIKKLKPFTKAKQPDITEEESPVERRLISQKSMLVDVSLECQVYSLICSAGKAGVTSKIIEKVFPTIGKKILTKIIGNLTGAPLPMKKKTTSNGEVKFPVHAILEFDGKIKSFRYYGSDLKIELGALITSLDDEPEIIPMDISNINSTANKICVMCKNDFDETASFSCANCSIVGHVDCIVNDDTNSFCTHACQETFNSVKAKPSSNEDLKGILASNGSSALSINAAVRSNAILDILNTEKAVEFGKPLMDKVIEQIEAKGYLKMLKYKMDRKTLKRTVDDMAKKGLVIVHSVLLELPTGQRLTKKLVLHSGVKNVQQYKEALLQQYAQTSVIAKVVPNKPVFDDVIEVEHLRFKDEKIEPLVNLDGDGVLQLGNEIGIDGDIGELDENDLKVVSESFGQEDKEPNNAYWRKIAVGYGYQLPLFQRVRTLHNWILKYLMDNRDRGGVMQATSLFTELPFEIFLKIIGVTSLENNIPSEILAQYQSTKLSQLPRNLRVEYVIIGRLRTHMTKLVRMLEDLELIESNKVYDTSIPVKFMLNKSMPLYDYSSDPPTLIATTELRSPASIDIYWDQLKSRCYNLMKEKLKAPKGSFSTPFLVTLLVSRNWDISFVFPKEAMAILDSFMDKKKYTTPIKNNNLLLTLANRTGLPVYRIRLYYQKYEDSFSRMLLHKTNRLLATSGNKDVLKSLYKLQKRRNQVDSGVDETGDYKMNVKPDFHRVRNTWTAEDDESILLGYVILSHFPVNKGYPLPQMLQLFPNDTNLTKDQIRRRIGLLRKDRVKVNFLRASWVDYDKWLVETKQRQTSFDHNVIFNSLKAVVAGFKEYLKKFHSTPGDDNENIQLVLDRCISQLSKLSVLYSANMNINTSSDDLCDFQYQPETLEEKESNILSVLLKMILITPDAVYNSETAWSILQRFSESAAQSVIQSMQAQGTIKKLNPADAVKHLFHRNFQFSEKYLKLLSGSLSPRLFPQSSRYSAAIKNQEDINIPQTKTPGVMAVILDLFAKGRVKSRIELPENIELKERSGKNNFVVKCLENPIIVKLSNMDTIPVEKENTERTIISASRKRVRLDDNESMDADSSSSQLELVARVVKLSERQLLEILGVIRTFGVLGCSIVDLHKSIPFDIKFRTLQDLLNSLIQPGYVGVFGSNYHQYVHKDFINECKIQVKKITERTLTENETPATAGPFFMEARMWNDIHGDMIKPIYRACLETVLGIIVNNPGIMESKIYDRVSCILTRVELRIVLDELVSRGACFSEAYVLSDKNTGLLDDLFDDPRPMLSKYESIPDDVNPEDIVTCYFVLSDWYLKTSVE